MPLYRAVAKYSQTQNAAVMQNLVWTLVGAGTNSPFSNRIDSGTLKHFDRAMPGGAKLFTDYHQQRLILNGILNLAIGLTGLGQYIKAEDLTNPRTRQTAITNQLNSLIQAGYQSREGRGVGYAMIAEGIAISATGTAPLTMNVIVANASGKPYELNTIDWYGKPLSAKQGISATLDITKVQHGRFKTLDGGPELPSSQRGNLPAVSLDAYSQSDCKTLLKVVQKDFWTWATLLKLPGTGRRTNKKQINLMNQAIQWVITEESLTTGSHSSLHKLQTDLIKNTPLMYMLEARETIRVEQPWYLI